MINEEKLRLMTRTALLEKNSRNQFNINRYFKKDYISYHVILIWLCITAAFMIVAGGAAAVYIEQYPEAAQQQDLSIILFTLLMFYVIIVVIYVIIAMFVYAIRYDHAQAVIRKYNNALRLLEREYEKEEGRDAVPEAVEKEGKDKPLKKKNAVKRKGGSRE